ncbi:MAG: YbgA family protein [Thermoanaerobaculia bacterium]
MPADAPALEIPKVRIGISACLLGQEVRYNGGHKRDAFLTDTFGRYVEWVAVCPEVELGMGTPRPPIRLERHGGEVRLVMPSSGEDYTDAMRAWATRRAEALAGMDLDGYVLKKDSPSCGMERVKVYPAAVIGAPSKDGRGLFAEALMERLPDLPVEEEGRLNDPLLRETFVARVFVHRRWREGERAGWTRGSLMRFHERHKLLLMARNQTAMRRLGSLLGEAGREAPVEELAAAYRSGLREVLSRPATRRNHANVLSHLAGYVSDALDREDRAEVAETVERYRLGLVPLVVPLTLIRHHVRRQAVAYLQDQVYLDPHPHELMLLNHV